MATKTPVAEKLSSNADHAAPTAWQAARPVLEGTTWYWLTTVRPDGEPHMRPVFCVSLDNVFYFVSNAETRKSKNLAHNGQCAIAVMGENMHLVIEGEAVQVHDAATLQRIADLYDSKYEWHVAVRDGAFYAEYGAPTAGPSPYRLFAMTPARIYGFGTDASFSPTRWRF